MKIEQAIAFVTGSNRGLGRSLVDTLLARGATKIYATSRDGADHWKTSRVVPVRLDVTDAQQVRAAAALANDATLVINNAGTLSAMSLVGGDPEGLAKDLAVNVYGVIAVARAFAPQLPRGSAIANVLSVVSLASMPALGGYSASKAAAWSVTQSLRGELAPKGIAVHAVFPGPIDTDMIRSFDMPKTAAPDVAQAIVDGIAASTLDIAPDPMSSQVLATYLRDPRAVERQFAG